MNQGTIDGIGLGLRWEFLDEVLLASDDALRDIRFFEVSPENYMRRGGYFPDALARVGERRPITTHGLMMSLGSPDALDRTYLSELRGFLSHFHGAWHSDHLSFSGADGIMLHDLLPVPFTSKVAQHFAERIREASERLQRPLAVENISYYMTLGTPEMDEPEFISEVLERAGCGLLLDVNNLDVNAKNHRFDAYRWLERIDLDKVVEIHVAGPEPHQSGMLLDTHGAPVEKDVYALLEWVLERTGPKPILLERDNNIPHFSELCSEVQSLQHAYDRGVGRWQSTRERHHAA